MNRFVKKDKLLREWTVSLGFYNPWTESDTFINYFRAVKPGGGSWDSSVINEDVPLDDDSDGNENGKK